MREKHRQQAILWGVFGAILTFGGLAWLVLWGPASADQSLNSETPDVAYPEPGPEAQAYPEPEMPNPDAEVGREWVPVPDDLPEGCFPLYMWPMEGTYKHVGGIFDGQLWVYHGSMDVRIDGDVVAVEDWSMYPQGGHQFAELSRQGQEQGKNWIRIPDYTSLIGCEIEGE